MSEKIIRFGIIGCGLMAREFASAVARWSHLLDLGVRPRIVAVADRKDSCLCWFNDNVPDVHLAVNDYQDLLADPEVDAVYCAVPHHLHAQMYSDIIAAGKHLLGEKPFGIDLAANRQILDAARARPDVFVRSSSQQAFFPGAYQIVKYLREQRFGKIIEVEAGFWHSSDMDPLKPINWKRQVAYNGEYGCMGDLGLHVLYIPLRFGWMPRTVQGLLSKIVTERPDGNGNFVPCETWDNAILACDVATGEQHFPMLASMKRIAPGETNTWFIKVHGTEFSAEFSTKYPKTLRTMTYRRGEPQAWLVRDMGYESAYPTITGSIFEFGFSDAIMQMLAAYCDELAHGEAMQQPFGCARPEETEQHHRILTAALESQRSGQLIHLS
jgi:predicted dehydrogenase